MALITLPRPRPLKGMLTYVSSTPSVGSANTMDASGEYEAWVGYAEQDLAVSHVAFFCNAASGSPTAEIRIETVDTSNGRPSGTLWGTNTNATTSTLSATTHTGAVALTATATIPAGSLFAVVIKYASGTSFAMGLLSNYTDMIRDIGLPYRVSNTGTPTKAAFVAGLLMMSLGSSATSFYSIPGMVPHGAATTNSFNNTSGARQGLLFRTPFACRARGILLWNGSAAGDLNFGMRASDGTELSSSLSAFDKDTVHLASTNSIRLIFDNPVVLTPGVDYRASIEPSSTTNVQVPYYTLPSADYIGATAAGSYFQRFTYTTGGGYDDSNTTHVPAMDVLIDQLSDDAGGGASRRFVRGMRGGMQ